jgi:hypothetical protein
MECKRSLNKVLAVFLIAILLLSLSVPAAAQAVDRRVHLFYMIGSNLEDDHGYGSQMINALWDGIDGRYTPNRYIFRIGGAHHWQLEQISANRGTNTDFEFYTRTDGAALFMQDSTQSRSMGAPVSLTEFLVHNINQYNDGHTAFSLHFWDHGKGPNYGFGSDHNYGRDSLTTAEMAQAFRDAYRQTGVKLELINFHACNMANLETAAVLSPYADYMLASQDAMYATNTFEVFAGDPSNAQSITNLAKTYIDAYAAEMAERGASSWTTLALIDLSKIPAVTNALSQVAPLLSADLDSADSFNALLDARKDACSFGAYPDTDFFLDLADLSDLMTRLRGLHDAETAEVQRTAGDAVSYFAAAPDNTRAHGLSIYYPLQDSRLMLSDITKYQSFSFEPNYQRFIKSLYDDYYMTLLAPARHISDWAVPDVQEAFSQGILEDISISEYWRNMTRLDCATLLVNLYEYITGASAPRPDETPFTDTANAYALKAYGLGIALGNDQRSFLPNSQISRQQFAAMIVRFLEITYDGFSLPSGLELKASDADQVSGYAYDAMAYLMQQGILKGRAAVTKSGTKLYADPLFSASIEQGIAICERLFRFYQGSLTRQPDPVLVAAPPDMMAYANYLSGKVTIINYGKTPVSLEGCYMEADMFSNRYSFPSGLTLAPDQTIIVLTGSSAEKAPLDENTYYWTRSVLFSKPLKSYTGKIFTADGKVLIPVTMQIILEAK